MDGMPYSYNKAIADHPDMKEFVEGVWMAGERKMARIAELEAKVAEWEAWFDALERFDGPEPPSKRSLVP